MSTETRNWPSLRHLDTLLAALLGGVAFLLYSCTLAPTGSRCDHVQPSRV
jgi:hypothetical protein